LIETPWPWPSLYPPSWMRSRWSELSTLEEYMAEKKGSSARLFTVIVQQQQQQCS
jgi:hypothetical protein